MEISNLSKKYAGKLALDDLSMKLPQGKIMGLLGPNGSGKTTLMKIIAGLLSPDSGELKYAGGLRRGTESKGITAFLPDKIAFPDWMKVKDAFEYFRRMYPDYDADKAAFMQELLELSPDIHIKKLSKGMQERLALGLTFSRKASLYLLDEPLGGIDLVGRVKVLESIISTHREDSSILISTHLIRDVETVFDSFFLIKDGRIAFEGDCEDIRQQMGKKVEDIYLEVFGGV